MFKNNINCSSCCAALVSRSFLPVTGHTFFDNDNKHKQSIHSTTFQIGKQLLCQIFL